MARLLFLKTNRPCVGSQGHNYAYLEACNTPLIQGTFVTICLRLMPWMLCILRPVGA
jgi:hypothetical protein